MIFTVELLHVAAAAAWFGHKLLIPGDLRRAIHEPATYGEFVSRMGRARRLGLLAGSLTLLSGVALTHLTTGIASAPLRIYLGLAAVLAMFLVGATVAAPAWRRVEAGMLAGDAPRAAAGMARFNRSLGLESLLWVLALTTMLW